RWAWWEGGDVRREGRTTDHDTRAVGQTRRRTGPPPRSPPRAGEPPASPAPADPRSETVGYVGGYAPPTRPEDIIGCVGLTCETSLTSGPVCARATNEVLELFD